MSDEENVALVIKTSVEQLFVPLQRLLDQLLGQAATEVGLAISDSVKVLRFRRQIRLLQEVQRLIEGSGKDISPVATRLFFPTLEAASIEDDDEMQTRWAALLANEATKVGSVHPSYIDVLKQLSPEDARLLDTICDWSERYNTQKLMTNSWRPQDRELESILESAGDSLDNLVRLGLVQSEYDIDRRDRNEGRIPIELDSWLLLTDFAVRFVSACRAPTPT